jgi:hypothetical protein
MCSESDLSYLAKGNEDEPDKLICETVILKRKGLAKFYDICNYGKYTLICDIPKEEEAEDEIMNVDMNSDDNPYKGITPIGSSHEDYSEAFSKEQKTNEDIFPVREQEDFF